MRFGTSRYELPITQFSLSPLPPPAQTTQEINMASIGSSIHADIELLGSQARELKIRERQLSDQLEGCRTSRRQIETRIAALQNQTAPVSKLPEDVLILIFEAGHKNSRENSLPFAILVSHVSATWRSMALRAPFLWATVTVNMFRWSAMNELYLARSKPCLLNVCLLCDAADSPPEFPEGFSELFDASHLHPLRCQTLTIAFHSYYSSLCFFPHIKDITMPFLTSLTIEYLGDSEEGDSLPAQPVHIFQSGTPSLSRLELRGFSLRFCMPPLERLKTLHFCTSWHSSPLSYAVFSHALSRCANTLTHFVFRGDWIVYVDQSDLQLAIQLPALRSLEIDFSCYHEGDDPGRSLKTLSRCFIMPVLENLSLGALAGLEFFSVADLLTDRIETLSFAYVDLDKAMGLVQAKCPHIKSLNVSGSSKHIKHVLRAIVKSDEQTESFGRAALWPRLCYLRVHCLSGLCPYQLFRDVLQSRRNIGYPLHSHSITEA